MVYFLALMESLFELLKCLLRQGKASGSSRNMNSQMPKRFVPINFLKPNFTKTIELIRL